MSPRMTAATAIRVLRQLRHDLRTIALVLIMPSAILVILRFVFEGAPQTYNSIAPLILGIMAFAIMLVVTSVATLRERTTGTMERLMASPIGKLDLVLGYSIAFGILSLIQSGLGTLVVVGLFDVILVGTIWQMLVLSILSGITGMAFGLFLSEFATSEFQAVQFMPAFAFPQLLICGLFIPRDHMADNLQRLANAMPLTYVVDGMNAIKTSQQWGGDFSLSLVALALFALTALMLGAITMRRHTS